MTSHGFGGLRAGSKISEDEVAEFARRISELPGVIWAHVVEGPRYNIIFEFGHKGQHYKTHEDLLKRILKIKVNKLGIHEPIDLWRIPHDDDSFQHGKPKPKPDLESEK